MAMKSFFHQTLVLFSIAFLFVYCSTNDQIQKRPLLTENSIVMDINGLVDKSYDDYTSWSLYTTVAEKSKAIDYSIYESKFNKYLIISEDQDSSAHIKLEYIGKKGPTSKNQLDEIEQRRKEWMNTCNNHQVEELIYNFYTNPPYYYNHKPMIMNQEDLIEQYAYMTAPDYSLTLSTLFIEAVNERLVFEIGKCSGSYNGKYVIVWKKEGEDWKVHLDSNL